MCPPLPPFPHVHLPVSSLTLQAACVMQSVQHLMTWACHLLSQPSLVLAKTPAIRDSKRLLSLVFSGCRCNWFRGYVALLGRPLEAGDFC